MCRPFRAWFFLMDPNALDRRPGLSHAASLRLSAWPSARLQEREQEIYPLLFKQLLRVFSALPRLGKQAGLIPY